METLALDIGAMGKLATGVLVVAIILFFYLYTRDYRRGSSSNGADGLTAGTKINWQEKRGSSRVDVKWPVTIETAEGSYDGEIVNVSTGGAFICGQKLPRLKETFRLTINPLNHQAVIITAEVLWSNFSVPESEVIKRGMGVRFLDVADEDRRFISGVVADYHQKHKNRREAIRKDVKWPVTIETTEGSLNGEIMNISFAGAFICCQKISCLKEAFRLTINPPNHQAVIVAAEVLWSNFNIPASEVINRGMGVRFLDVSDGDRRFISETLADDNQ